MHQKANPEKDRDFHALANYKDKLIVASGGMKPAEYKVHASAEVYSVDGNMWSPVPDMKVSRIGHGSCAVANYVYVACGSHCKKFLKSIERINMNTIYDGWEELLVSSSENLSPRRFIFMAGLSCDELVIIGGRGKGRSKGDGYILEIPQMRLKTVIKSTEASITFTTSENQNIKISDSKVACLTYVNDIVEFDQINYKTSILANLD